LKRRLDVRALERAGARLGEAALDPSRWPNLMEEICRAIGAEGAALLQSDARSPQDTPYTESLTELATAFFREGWHENDFRCRGIPLLLNGATIYTDQDIATPEEMRTAPFYNELIYAQGLKWSACIGFRAGSALWALSPQRTSKQGPFEIEETRALAKLSPLLAEVATLSNAIGRIALSSGINALNAMGQPAIALDRLGCVLGANEATEAILDFEICVRNHRLVVADHRARSDIDEMVLRLSTAPETAPLSGLEPMVIRRTDRPPSSGPVVMLV